ncbi:hypothetical protein J5X84_44760 [Streptosporangiaceae bacterium NEAU-GS5]|nr:hypothetical protein [Streptosporangiaceae bacterium NEAU-GS5]
MLRWNDGTRNRATAAGLAVLLLGSAVGCGKSATKAPTTAATTAPSGTAAGSAPIVSGAKLAMIDLPEPHGAPRKGTWSDVAAIDDGDRRTYYRVGDDGWVFLWFLDCNLPKVKAEAHKSDHVQHVCVTDATEKINGYPLFKTSDIRRVVKVGHLLLIADVSGTHMDSLTADDLEAFFASVDLAAIAAL